MHREVLKGDFDKVRAAYDARRLAREIGHQLRLSHRCVEKLARLTYCPDS